MSRKALAGPGEEGTEAHHRASKPEAQTHAPLHRVCRSLFASQPPGLRSRKASSACEVSRFRCTRQRFPNLTPSVYCPLCCCLLFLMEEAGGAGDQGRTSCKLYKHSTVDPQSQPLVIWGFIKDLFIFNPLPALPFGRGKVVGSRFSPPSSGFRGLSSGQQAWGQAPFLTEPSLQRSVFEN